jgi:cell division septum initiation protein DivIVA
MEKSVDKLDRIINKIGLILEDNLKLKEELNQLKNKVTELENDRNQVKANYEKAVVEMQRLKLAKNVEVSSEEKVLIKKELKNYMKEIDKCLALLNK